MNALLAADPLFADGIDWTVMAVVVVKVLVAFVILLVSVMLYIWGMRKWIADMQNRVGPANAGPAGVLQTLADGIKLFFKEQSIPDSADRPIFRLAPYLSILPAFLMFCVVPIGGEVSIFGRKTYLQVAELPIGAMFILACSGVAVYGVMLAGWASGSKYPLLGAVRASAQVLSYEAAFGLGILSVLMRAGTLSTREIVEQQAWVGGDRFYENLGNWYLLPASVGFVIFIIAAIAETNHPPFDFVEAEQELVGGFVTEYTGIRFAIFFLAEFMNIITMSAVATTLFLGGPSGPAIWPDRLSADGWINATIVPVVWFVVKVLGLTFCTVWIRASLPRLRYDQLMALGWKWLIELAVLFVLVTAALIVLPPDDAGFLDNIRYGAAIIAAAAVAYGILYLCMPKPGESVEEFR